MRPLREEEDFARFLRSRGMRVTAERRALLRSIFAQHRHIDADQVLAAARAAGHKISRATVYRNLELLVECGLVHKVRLGERRFLFEHVRSGQHHDHIACRQCGRIAEFVSPGVYSLLADICRSNDFDPRSNELHVLGVCRSCAEAAVEEGAASPSPALAIAGDSGG